MLAPTRALPAPLRILVVVDGYFPATGGAERQAALMSATFVELGHTVQILAPRLDVGRPVDERMGGIAVHRIAYPRIRRLGAAFMLARFAFWLIRRRRTFDVLQVHMVGNMAAVAGWLRPWLGVPIVAKVAGAGEMDGGVLDQHARRGPLQRLLDAGTRRIDAFQCISREVHGALLDAGYAAARLHLVPNAVDCARFDWQPRPTVPRMVACVGRQVPVKGHDVLLRAWSLVRRPPGTVLMLAGDGPEHARLRAMADKLALGAAVVFAGNVDDVPGLLGAADVFVQPSHQEGLPNAVLEAMASGLAVVATRVGGHGDVIEHARTGLLVPPGDPDALAGALQALLDDDGLRARMGLAARAAVLQGYGTDVVARRLLALYRAADAPVRPSHAE